MTTVIDVCGACAATGRHEGGRGQEPRGCSYCGGSGFITVDDADDDDDFSETGKGDACQQ